MAQMKAHIWYTDRVFQQYLPSIIARSPRLSALVIHLCFCCRVEARPALIVLLRQPRDGDR